MPAAKPARGRSQTTKLQQIPSVIEQARREGTGRVAAVNAAHRYDSSGCRQTDRQMLGGKSRG